MRNWYKHSLKINNPKDVARVSGQLNRDPEEYLEERFRNILKYQIFESYLEKTLSVKKKTLSIGSGPAINEARLMGKGYDITCSDVDISFMEEAKSFFQKMPYFIYDVTEKPSKDKYDTVISLGVFFLFNRSAQSRAFQNIARSLNSGGELILDIGGATDNFLTRAIDIYRIFENYCSYLYVRAVQREKCSILKKQNGYRVTTQEIIDVAIASGFVLKHHEEHDTLSEFKRSRLIRRMFVRAPFFKEIFGRLGKNVPHIRILHFTLSDTRSPIL